MAEAEAPSRPSSAAKVEQRDILKKVEEETPLLMKKLAELDAQRADLTRKVKGKSVYDELQEHRQPRNNAATRTPTAESEGVGALLKNMQGTHTSAPDSGKKGNVRVRSSSRCNDRTGICYDRFRRICSKPIYNTRQRITKSDVRQAG